MRCIGRRLFAAAIGVLILTATVSAQAPKPAKSYVMVYPGQPAPTAAQPDDVKWVAAKTVTIPAADVAVAAPVPVASAAPAAECSTCNTNSCSTCGKSSSKFLTSLKGRLAQPGCANPEGCGNWRSEKTFFWGGCCQFFNCGRDCGSCGGGYWSKCPGMVYGPGLSTGMNPCSYDTYLK